MVLEPNLTDEYKKLVTLVAGGVPPDTAQAHYSNGVDLAVRGVIQSLDSLMSRDRINRADYVPGAVHAFQWKGVQYAIPKDNGFRVLFYNLDLFDKVGVRYPDESWTWDTWLDAARRLTVREGGAGKQWGTTALWAVMNDAPSWYLIRTFGGELYNADFTEFLITKPETVDAIQWSADLELVHNVVPKSAELPTPGDSFINGYAAMTINFAQMVFNLKQAKASHQYDVVVLPAGRAGRVLNATSSAHSLPTGAAKADAGWELLKYLTGPEAQRAVTELKRWGSSRIDTLEAILPTDGVPKHFKEALIEPLQGKSKWKVEPVPIPPRAAEVAEMYLAEFNDVRSGKRTAKEAAAALKPQVDALLRSK
jgi:multiple sugar transport system substrate-binding protein